MTDQREPALNLKDLDDLRAIIERRIVSVRSDGPSEVLPGLEAIHAEIVGSIQWLTDQAKPGTTEHDP